MRNAQEWIRRQAAQYARPPELLAAAALAAAMVAIAWHIGWPLDDGVVAAWAVAAACGALAGAGYALRRYRLHKADPYARMKREYQPQFDMPRMGPQALALAAGESLIRVKRIPRKPDPGQWTLELIRALEWKRFGLLCSAYYGHREFRAETLPSGAGGGVDAKLYFKSLRDPVAILHCRAWGSRTVGVKPLRELLDVMRSHGVAKGIFHATGDYTSEARAFAAEGRIQLVTGAELAAKLVELPEAVRKAILDLVTEGDYTTPTCPACGRKMAMYSAPGGDVWGCGGFPECRATLQVETLW